MEANLASQPSTSGASAPFATQENENRVIEEQRAQIAQLEQDITGLKRMLQGVDSTPVNTPRDQEEDSPITMGNLSTALERAFSPILKRIENLEKKSGDHSVPGGSTGAMTTVTPLTPIRGRRPAEVVSQGRRASRGRSRTRSGSRPPIEKFKKVGKKNRPPPQPLLRYNPDRTMASAFASAPVQLNNRFTILSVAETEDENFRVMNSIQGSTALSNLAPIRSIVKRSSRCLAVECDTEEGAAILESNLVPAFPTSISITVPQPKTPHIKVTGCAVANYTEADIQSTNTWLNDDIKVIRTYDAGAGNRIYRNLVIGLSLQDHANAIARAKMLVGFLQCNVFEFSDPIQCKKCWRYGHFKHSCKFTAVCRICGKGSHLDDSCDASRDQCINCIRYNRDSVDTIVNTNHRVTDERCPIRVSRNERVKDFLQAKRPRRGGRDQQEQMNASFNLDATIGTVVMVG